MSALLSGRCNGRYQGMLSVTSSPRLIMPIKSTLLQTADAKSLLETDSRESRLSGSTSVTAKTSLDTDKASNSKGSGGSASSEKAVQSNQKTIVDQRTTDAGPVKITVIAYSDGSSDTLREIKDRGFASLAGAQPNKSVSLSDKGLVFDNLA